METRDAALAIIPDDIRVVASALEGRIADTVPVAIAVVEASVGSEYIVFEARTLAVS